MDGKWRSSAVFITSLPLVKRPTGIHQHPRQSSIALSTHVVVRRLVAPRYVIRRCICWRNEKGERERERERRMKKEQLSGNWRTRRMAVLICTRSLELKVPSGALINLGVREERRFLERDSEERERERERRGPRKKDSCYRRTRSPQDVIAEQTEGPRTISINEIHFPSSSPPPFVSVRKRNEYAIVHIYISIPNERIGAN